MSDDDMDLQELGAVNEHGAPEALLREYAGEIYQYRRQGRVGYIEPSTGIWHREDVLRRRAVEVRHLLSSEIMPEPLWRAVLALVEEAERR